MIGNVFMHYFFSSLTTCWDRGKNWYRIFCWYIWCAWYVQILLAYYLIFKLESMDKILSNGVLRSSLRQNLAPVALCRFEWFWVKIINFRDLKILKKFFHFYQKAARYETSGFLTYRAPKGIFGKLLVYTFEFSKLQNSSMQLHTSGTSYGPAIIMIFWNFLI